MSVHEDDTDTQFTTLNASQSVDQVDHHYPLYIYPYDTQVSLNLVSTVIYASDAYTVWEDLKEIFEKVNASRAAYLYKEIATLTQGVSSVSVYFSRLRELWDEYETLTPPPTCGCSESKKHSKDQWQVVYGSNDVNEVVAMMSNRHYNNSGGFNKQWRCKGHTKENCFKLLQPSDFKNKKRGGNFNAQSNNMLNKGKDAEPVANSATIGITEKNQVYLPTGEKATITHTGICFFFRDKKELFSGKVLRISKKKLGLYILKDKDRQFAEPHLPPTINTIVSSTNKCASKSNTQSDNKFALWHKRLPAIILQGKTPFDALFQKVPSIQHLRVFDSLHTYKSNQQPLSNHISQSSPTSQPFFPTLISDDPSTCVPAEVSTDHSPPVLRRSSRPSKPHVWLTDYVVQPKKSTCPYLVSHEANVDPKWMKAMQAEISTLKENNTWSIVDLPPGKSRKGILMCQGKYALELVSELGLASGKPVCTPLEFNHNLTSVEFDQEVNNNASEDIILEDKGSYQRLIGRLLYLTMTRLDIAFVVQTLSQYMHAPKTSHMDATRRVVRYIKSTPGLGLFKPTGSCKHLITYCDSDWGACVQSRRLVTEYVVQFGDALIS
ncbi:uncharacterized protein LOC142176384 [Nicotiana tabacum]|uniref:Uncharacterized protein LOC142176384 n=1 Tax=Nicotiana tabacum TaxID=4097 RepID=A0AC58TRY5_TOBAC